jgi:DNA repair exonuclease SbcCD ATPase subunit
MQILDLEISDILSVQSASIKFEDSGLVLMEGWNYDTGRANGAGKSVIWNCLSFALFDRIPRKITASEILRRGSKTGFVKCNLICGENVWTVQRIRPKGVRFFKDGLEQHITQEEFETNIRLSYDQFIRTIYTPQANSGSLERFLASPDATKKQFLLHLLNLEKFNGLKKVADEKVKQTQSLIDRETSLLESNKSKIIAYKESIVDIGDLELKIKSIQDGLIPVEKEIIDLSTISRPDLSKYTKIENDAKTKYNEIVHSKAEKNYLWKQYAQYNASLTIYDSNVKCSECNSSLASPEGKIAHEQHQQLIVSKMQELKNQLDNCESMIVKEQSILDLLNKIRLKKDQESTEFNKSTERLSELKLHKNMKNSQLENLMTKVNNNSILESKIRDLEDKVIISNNISDMYKKDLELYKTLSSIYSPTGAQAYVLDSVVDSFNEVIQKYIDLLSPNMSYILNSYKETSKKEVVAKFSETLTKGGKEVSVGSLSGGEEKGLSLCVDFALLEVLETQFGMSLNPIVLDEPFDGLDTTGREIVIELLEQLARNRQIFVVDHSSEAKSMFSKVIRIELRNEISSLV